MSLCSLFLLAAVPDGFFRTRNKPPHKQSPAARASFQSRYDRGLFMWRLPCPADPQAQPVAEGHGAGPIAQSGPHRFLERLQLWQDGLRGGADQRLHPALAEGQREQPIGAPSSVWAKTSSRENGNQPLSRMRDKCLSLSQRRKVPRTAGCVSSIRRI